MPTVSPVPRSTRRVGAFTVDLLWREQRLVVELDGYDTHRTREAFEYDRARDRTLATAGLRCVRVTWRQMEDDGPAVAADLATLLSSTDRPQRRGATR